MRTYVLSVRTASNASFQPYQFGGEVERTERTERLLGSAVRWNILENSVVAPKHVLGEGAGAAFRISDCALLSHPADTFLTELSDLTGPRGDLRSCDWMG